MASRGSESEERVSSEGEGLREWRQWPDTAVPQGIGRRAVVLGIGTVMLGVSTVMLGIGTVMLGIGTVMLGISTVMLGIGTVMLGISTVMLGIGTAMQPGKARLRSGASWPRRPQQSLKLFLDFRTVHFRILKILEFSAFRAGP